MCRMLDLKDCKLGLSLTLLSSLNYIYGPKYLIECFPSRNVQSLNLGIWKSLFLIAGYHTMFDFIHEDSSIF